MKIKSSEEKYYLEISGKGLITSLGLKTMRRSKKKKKARYYITTVSLKDIYRIIKKFEKLTSEGYVQKRSRQVPTDSYFYLERQLDKCMMRLNSHVGPVRTQIDSTENIPN